MVLQWAQSNPFLRSPLTDHVSDEANERFILHYQDWFLHGAASPYFCKRHDSPTTKVNDG
ncbi:hypothetical protein GCM10007919_20990 [Rhizobium indigoferae]|nr:hypothetical protein GCM10007919_20990 [Rhizobium indigoferae]